MQRQESEIIDHAVRSWPVWGTISAALLTFIYFLIRVIASRLADEIGRMRESIDRLDQRMGILESIIPQVAGHESQIAELFEDAKILNTRVSRIEGAHTHKRASD